MPIKKTPNTAQEARNSSSRGSNPNRRKKPATSATGAIQGTIQSPTGEVIYSLRAGTPIFVKTADICAATGKSNQWIGQLISQGILHKAETPNGTLFNLFETMKEYCSYIENKPTKKVTESELDIRKKKADAEYKEAKAEVARLEADEFQGKMHRSEDVQAMTADLLFFVRGALTAIPGRCATDCAASSEPNEVQKIIEREVFEILKDLSEYKYDPSRYDDLVRQRMKRDVNTPEEDGDE